MSKKFEVGSQDWLLHVENILAQLVKQAAVAQCWDLAAALAQAISASQRMSRG